MPNGGGHRIEVSMCPKCRSTWIYRRKGFLAGWECGKRKHRFMSPKLEQWYIPPGARDPWERRPWLVARDVL